jgi:hypothetical protein
MLKRTMILLITLLISSGAHSQILKKAYDDNFVHPRITEEAVNFLQNKYSGTYKVIVNYIDYIKQGSTDEDKEFDHDMEFRYRNHFFNPVNQKGLWTFENSYVWGGTDNSINSYDWVDAKKAYSLSKSDAFYKLGHVLHLIQDLTVPVHTNLIFHISDPLENYTKTEIEEGRGLPLPSIQDELIYDDLYGIWQSVAYESYPYYPYEYTPSELSSKLIPIAIRASAGAIKLFIDQLREQIVITKISLEKEPVFSVEKFKVSGTIKYKDNESVDFGWAAITFNGAKYDSIEVYDGEFAFELQAPTVNQRTSFPVEIRIADNSKGCIAGSSGSTNIAVDPVPQTSAAESTLPVSITLSQNYPNPFNDNTSVSFILSKPCWVSLKIFNVTGVEVAKLVDKAYPAGIHSVSWKAGENATGIYFYKIQTNTFTEIRKMLLLR